LGQTFLFQKRTAPPLFGAALTDGLMQSSDEKVKQMGLN
jgi:hypothetical protein